MPGSILKADHTEAYPQGGSGDSGKPDHAEEPPVRASAPMDDFQALEQAAATFADRLRTVRPSELCRPSCCSQWTVYEVINHVVGGGHRYLILLRGGTRLEAEATRGANHLGADPVLSFWAWQSRLAAEFARVGALARIVHHRAGDRTGGTLLGMRVVELTLHGWDLSHTLALNESLDTSLATHVLEHEWQLISELRRRGVCSPPTGSPGTDPRTQLLFYAGRTGRIAPRGPIPDFGGTPSDDGADQEHRAEQE